MGIYRHPNPSAFPPGSDGDFFDLKGKCEESLKKAYFTVYCLLQQNI
jgi:hypothetical protein